MLLRALLAGSLAALIAGHLAVTTAAAHPMGNFTINHHSALTVGAETIVVEQVIDMAEIPAFQELAAIDEDGNGQPGPEEASVYHSGRCADLAGDLELRLAGRLAPLSLEQSTVSFPPGVGGLLTLRLSCRYRAPVAVPAEGLAISFADRSYAERLGWREIVVRGDGLRVDGAPAASVSAALTNYPDDLLSSPLDVREVRFSVTPGAQAPAEAAMAGPSPARADRLAELVTLRTLTPASVGLALLLAFVWGAAHAFAPGHGKTVVAAYLVGTRGTVGHALFLGLTTTITHTAGVFALGLLTLAASRFVVTEQLFPWLSLASGLTVVWLGVTMFAGRLRGSGGHHHHHGAEGHHHHHGAEGHTHEPPAGGVTWRNLLVLGVSGGLIPCPSALVVLLGAVALGRAGFGLALVLAFSLGLASVLTAIGVLFLYAGRLLDRVPASGPLLRLVPAASALCVAVLGAGITWRALAAMGAFG